MMCLIGLLGAALAGDPATVSTAATFLVGGRTAPESAILVPSAWEGEFEPSPLAALDLRARFGADAGPWARLGAGGWGYLTDADASELHGGAGAGWSGPVDVAGRYDLTVFPLISEATNGRAELLVRAPDHDGRWRFTPRLTLVDRRYFGSPNASFSTGEAGGILDFSAAPPLRIEAGLSGQVNKAGALGSEAPWGGQVRTLARVKLSGDAWRLSVEHRLTVALDGETEEQAPPVFTALGDYSDDVDALSGGGFLQNRIGVSGALEARQWTFSAGGLVRVRSAEADELASVYGRSFGGQVRAQRALGHGLAVFGTTGVNAAASSRASYTDLWGWTGLEWSQVTRSPR